MSKFAKLFSIEERAQMYDAFVNVQNAIDMIDEVAYSEGRNEINVQCADAFACIYYLIELITP